MPRVAAAPHGLHSSDRTLPHSLDAEQAVLGAIIVEGKLWSHATPVITPDDFFRVAHRKIFAAISALGAQDTAVDMITVRAELARRGELDECGGPAYLASLIDGMPQGANVEHYAEIVREHARLRALVAEGTRLTAQAYDSTNRAAVLADQAVKSLLAAVEPARGRLVSADEAMAEYAAVLGRQDGLGRVPFGYADLDELTGGCRPGDLVIVAGRPSTGKSSWALGAARNMAQLGHHTVFFSLEMERLPLAARLLSWSSRVNSDKLERGLATDDEYARVAAALGAPADALLLIEDSARTVTEVAAWCQRARRAGALHAVIVDYLQLLTTDERRESEEASIAAVSRLLKRLAKDLEVPVIALSQLSRAPEGRRDKRPHMSDLRGSGALEQDCDIAILLFREEMYKPTEENHGIAEVIVAKNRNGPTGVIRMAFIPHLAQFANLAWG